MKYQKRGSQIVDAEQFWYIDGIDGLLTAARAEELGLSRNRTSLLWEIKLWGGWRIIHEGDFVVYDDRGESSLWSREGFQRIYEPVPNQVLQGG